VLFTAKTVQKIIISDRTGSRNSNIVGLNVIGQAVETVILWGMSDRKGKRKSNTVGVYLIIQAAK